MRCLLAIPVFNEEQHLPHVLRAVQRYGLDTLVVNDGSTDGTGDLLEDRSDVTTLTHPENRGYGQSLISALQYAEKSGYEWVITMDCDEQHEPEQIPDFLEVIETDRFDLISGSRYLLDDPGDDAPPADRQRINLTINQLLEMLLGLRLTDSFCGFKAHRVSAMARLKLDEPGYAFPLQLWPAAVAADLRIIEIPVRRIYRDRNREFGGTLDDPSARLRHYLEVLLATMRRADTLDPTIDACNRRADAHS